MGVSSTGSLRSSVRILLDENIGAETDRWLRIRGNDVLSAVVAGLLGAADDVVYRFACETERVLITLNCQDFRLMEKFPPEQCGGILAVRMGHTGLAAVNSVLDRALRHFPESYFSRVFVLVSARIIRRSILAS